MKKKLSRLMPALIVALLLILFMGIDSNAATRKQIRVTTDPKTWVTSYSFIKNDEVTMRILVCDDLITTCNGYTITLCPLYREGFEFNTFDKAGNFYTLTATGLVEYSVDGTLYSLSKKGAQPKFFWLSSNNFLSKVVTAKGCMPISAFKKTEIGHDDLSYDNLKNHVVNTSSSSSLWIGGEKKYTLRLKNGNLFLNKTKVAVGAKKFFFLDSKKFGFIKKSGRYYTAKISTSKRQKLVKKRASKVTLNRKGFAVKVR